MLDPAFNSQLADWRLNKEMQLGQILELGIPGVQASVTAGGTLFTLRYSVDGFEDTLIFGRPPQQRILVVKKGNERYTRNATTDDERGPDKRKIDVSTDDLRSVINGWLDKRRAVDTLATIAARRGVNSELTPGA